MNCSRCRDLMAKDLFLDMPGALWRDMGALLALCKLWPSSRCGH